LPVVCLIEQEKLDPNKFIVDYNTGALVIHYAAHYGKIKALRVFLEKYQLNPNAEDYFKLTPFHYATRAGELGILVYLKDMSDYQKMDQFGHKPIHYAVMYGKTMTFLLLYFNMNCTFNSTTL